MLALLELHLVEKLTVLSMVLNLNYYFLLVREGLGMGLYFDLFLCKYFLNLVGVSFILELKNKIIELVQFHDMDLVIK